MEQYQSDYVNASYIDVSLSLLLLTHSPHSLTHLYQLDISGQSAGLLYQGQVYCYSGSVERV